MQTPRFPREEDLIPLLICWCLISILAWNVLLSLSNVPWPLSIRRAVESCFEESEKDRSGSARLPRDLHPRRRKSTFGEDRCRERVVYELRLSVRKPSTIDNDVDKHFLQEALKGMCIQKLLQKNPETTVEDWQENCDAFGMVEETATEASVEDESQMENISIGHSTDGVEVKMNTVDVAEEPECEALVEETNRVQRSIHPEKSSKGAVTFAEAPTFLSSRDTDRSKEKFSNDDAVGGVNWNGSRDEREEYAENARDRKNGVDVPPHEDEDDPQHKFGTHLEIGKGNPNENSGKYSMDSKMKIEDRPETRTSRSTVESFSVFIIREDDGSETGSNEYSSEKIINLEAGASKGAVRLPGNELTEEQKGKEREISSFEDESHSKMAVDGSAERLTPSREDYLGEQFGILPEKGANCTEEISIMHSGKNATQSREEKKEKDGLGPPPAAGCLKNDHKTESMMPLLLSVPISHGKEEDDLNAIIRRMIITEVRKHRKKEQAILQRAHSDTEIVVLNKGNTIRNRTGLLNCQGRTFFRDLLELEKILRNKLEDKPEDKPEGKPDESREDKFDGNVVKRDDSTNQNASPIKNDVDACDTVVDDPGRANNPQSPSEIVLTGDSDILLERKVNLPRLSGAEEEKPADAGRVAEALKPEYASNSTQTEYVYVIRAVRSCPLRKKRLPLQLQRLPSDCDVVCSKTVHANQDFSECIFRKASDNLIYEKGKGSLSPSYISVPERFRWRYLTPNTVSLRDHQTRPSLIESFTC